MKITKEQFKELIKESITEAKAEKEVPPEKESEKLNYYLRLKLMKKFNTVDRERLQGFINTMLRKLENDGSFSNSDFLIMTAALEKIS